MKKVILHPITIIVIILLIFLSRIDVVVYSLIFVLLHELVHYKVAKSYGYHLNKMYLMPYGGVISGEENWQNNDAFFIAAAGPIFNLITAVFFIALWWIFPSLYGYTLTIVRVNLALGITNLLPFYPLDGARIILSISKNKIKTLKILRVVGIIGGISFLILFIISCFYKINITLGIMGICIIFGALSHSKTATFVQAASNIDILKNYSRAIQRKELLIYINSPLYKLLKSMDDKHIYTVEFVDGNGRTVCILENSDLAKICNYPDKKEKLCTIIDLFCCKCN